MSRIMYDALSTEAATIPPDAELVAGYIDAGPHPAAPPWGPAEWALFPDAVHVEIATQASTNAGHVLDVEAGDATPEQAVLWCTMRRNAGATPSVYCSASAWPTCRARFAAAGAAEPSWWIASYAQPPDTSIPVGAVAHQYGGNAAGTWDISTVADYWPGVDAAPPAPPARVGESTMLLVDVNGHTYLVWTAAGRLLYRLSSQGALQQVVDLGPSDPSQPALVQAGGLAVVYGAAPGGKTNVVTWPHALPDGTPLASLEVK